MDFFTRFFLFVGDNIMQSTRIIYPRITPTLKLAQIRIMINEYYFC